MEDKIKNHLNKLEDKYGSMGQDTSSYLEGLLLCNYMPYWDYVNLDTLLTLQKPRTDYPDEHIFIIYHQITELYFRLCLHECEQISKNGKIILDNGQDKGWKEKIEKPYLINRLQRINAYFEALTKSYDVMRLGMDREQFLKFRMALLPASGFQSAQYRKIEISSTDLKNLVHIDKRDKFKDYGGTEEEIREIFEHIYWKAGATDSDTGEKTLTLRQVEAKYSEEFIALAMEYRNGNLWQKYKQLSEEDQKDPELIHAMRMLDANVNINWPLVHYKTAARYLQKDTSDDDTKATGGTNWQKYLPPRFMKRIFFPELWSEEEKTEWGKSWVDAQVTGGMEGSESRH